MIEGLESGAALPWWLLYPVTLLLLVFFAYQFWKVHSAVAVFACFALSFRFIASAHHEFTYKDSPLGLSWNALGSAGVFVLGLVLIRSRYLLIKQLFPCYCVIAVVILSGLANHSIPKIVDVSVKFGYLVVMALSIYEGLGVLGFQRMTNFLLLSFITPLGLQALSIAFGVVKASEGDGSVSYIGGYNHEAAFSVVLAIGLFLACFAVGLKIWKRAVLLIVFVAGIFLANYRTVIIAFGPMILTQFNVDILGRFSPRQRSIVAVFLLGISAAAVIGVGWGMQERFQDIPLLFEKFDDLFKPQDQYTYEERKLLSGRPYIWAGYVEEYLNGSTLTHILGYGPDAWIGVRPAYAHNTIVSTLYEYGVIGVLAICYLWGVMFYAALQTPAGARGKLIAAHIGFFLLNMATMPHWMLEGDILYGVICGYTIFLMQKPTGRIDELRDEPVLFEQHDRRPRPNILRAD
jgi:hypothetical protein